MQDPHLLDVTQIAARLLSQLPGSTAPVSPHATGLSGSAHDGIAPAAPPASWSSAPAVDPRISEAIAAAGRRVASRDPVQPPGPVRPSEAVRESLVAGSSTPSVAGGSPPAAPPVGAFGSPVAAPSTFSDDAALRVVASRLQAVPQSAPTPACPGAGWSRSEPTTADAARAGFPRADGFRIGSPSASDSGVRPYDVEQIRRDFPILHQRVHGKPLAWLDNAATTQKPQAVIDAISAYYARDNSNIHRAAHTLAARSTEAYEQARRKVARFLGAGDEREIVFVRGTTEGVNFVARTYGQKFLGQGDEIVLTTLEHHANIVPWQMVAKERGAVLRVVPVDDRGAVMLEEYQRLLGPRTRLVAMTHASNSLGTVLPISEMTRMAKRYGARVLIDGAQTVAHRAVDMREIGCDFFVFSGHKMFGPTGIGAVYVRDELHEILPPWQGGGNMIRNVTFEETTYAEAPAKFEAGTPNIADAVGLGAAIDYLERLGLPAVARYEHELLEYATEKLVRIDGLRLIGTAPEKVGVLSFVLRDRPATEVGRQLDAAGIAVRAGHHCAQPSLRRFGLEATVRPSLSIYNTRAEIDRLEAALRDMLRR